MLACSKMTWLRGLLSETGVPQLHANNTSSIQIVANPIFHKCTKHIEADFHSICEAFDFQIITIPQLSSNLQIAYLYSRRERASKIINF